MRFKKTSYNSIMRVKNDPTCSGYYDSEEIAMHVLCECDIYSAYTFERLSQYLLKPWELHNNPVHCLLKFSLATSIF